MFWMRSISFWLAGGLVMHCATVNAAAARLTHSLDGVWQIADGKAPEDIPQIYEHTVPVPGLAKLGWTEADLAARRQGDRGELKLAAKLRAETTMTLTGMAGRLQMRSVEPWKDMRQLANRRYCLPCRTSGHPSLQVV
jgi:hypothetical protein